MLTVVESVKRVALTCRRIGKHIRISRYVLLTCGYITLLVGSCRSQQSLTAAQEPAQAPLRTCGTWSKPETIVGVPASRSVRWPSASSFKNQTIVVANHFPVSPTDSIGPRPFFIWSSRDGLLSFPVEGKLFAYPKGIFDSAGVFHLFWGEGQVADSTKNWLQGWPKTITSVWYAAYASGKWSQPEVVLKSRRIFWGSEGGQITATGGLHLVISAATPSGDMRLHHLRRNHGSWDSQALARFVSYATITRRTELRRVPWTAS